jgi:hypothetical protein
MKFIFSILIAVLSLATTSCTSSKPKQADLPIQPDRWVSYVNVDPESKVQYIGKTINLLITDVTQVKEISNSRPIRIGDKINGLTIGAIKCSFHWNDSGYGNSQFMWRGKWGCMDGRDRFEINNAVNNDGGKNFDYIHIAPVSL